MASRFPRVRFVARLGGLLCFAAVATEAAPLADLSGGQTGAIEYSNITTISRGNDA